MPSSLIRGRYVITHAASRHDAAVIEDGAVFQRDGRIVAVGPYRDGRFTRLDKQAVLDELAAAMARPPTEVEQRNRALGRDVMPYVRRFYEGWLDERPREPFYRPSSRT